MISPVLSPFDSQLRLNASSQSGVTPEVSLTVKSRNERINCGWPARQ